MTELELIEAWLESLHVSYWSNRGYDLTDPAERRSAAIWMQKQLEGYRQHVNLHYEEGYAEFLAQSVKVIPWPVLERTDVAQQDFDSQMLKVGFLAKPKATIDDIYGPPKKGTHETQLGFDVPPFDRPDGTDDHDAFCLASDWSRS